MRVAFIGLGNMGASMAMNVLRGGYDLGVYDLRPSAMQPLVEAGARPLAGAAEAASGSDLVFTSLPTLGAVEAVYLGNGGLVESSSPGQLLVDLSTILPQLAKRVHDRAASKDVDYLDCPVSGGTEPARKGTLTLMAGGREEAFHRVEPVLRLIGSNVYYVGSSGTGTLVKLINQLLMGVNNAGLLEGIALAERSGIDLDRLLEILSVSSGDSAALRGRAHRIIAREYRAGASVDIVEKDMSLVLSLAEELGAEVPMAVRAREVYGEGKESGKGALDIAAISDLYRER